MFAGGGRLLAGPGSGARGSAVTLRIATLPAIALAGLLCWGGGLGAFFAQDDFLLLEGSRSAWDVSRHIFAWMAQAFGRLGLIDDNYRPLSTHVYFAAIQGLFGLRPAAFHLLALVLHIGTSLMVCDLARKLGASRGAALVAGLFYVSRDALFGAVAWISGIQDGLMTFFVTGAAWTLACRARTGKRGWMFLSVLFFAGALFSKETALVSPVILSVLAWSLARERGWLAALKICIWHWVAWGAFCLFRLLCVEIVMKQYEVGIGPFAALRPGLYAFWNLLGWDVLNAEGSGWLRASGVFGWIVLAGGAWFMFRIRKGRSNVFPLAVAGGAWWTVGILPALFQTSRLQMYYLCLPAAGASLLLAAYIDTVRPINRTPSIRGALIILLAALLVFSGAIMTEMKRRGAIRSGVFYNHQIAEQTRGVCLSVKEALSRKPEARRIVFIDFADGVVLDANPDGEGTRPVSTLASMVRVMFARPDIEVFYALTGKPAPGQIKSGLKSIVDADEFFSDGALPGDVLLAFDKSGRLREVQLAPRQPAK